VIAFAGGSVREVVDHGLTGYVVSEIPEAVRAVERAASLDRAAIRREFERRFTADRMARDYAGLYARQIEERARKACEPASMT
jgi:glycosyltransferase involved in cell wall biosynthesis